MTRGFTVANHVKRIQIALRFDKTNDQTRGVEILNDTDIQTYDQINVNNFCRAKRGVITLLPLICEADGIPSLSAEMKTNLRQGWIMNQILECQTVLQTVGYALVLFSGDVDALIGRV